MARMERVRRKEKEEKEREKEKEKEKVERSGPMDTMTTLRITSHLKTMVTTGTNPKTTTTLLNQSGEKTTVGMKTGQVMNPGMEKMARGQLPPGMKVVTTVINTPVRIHRVPCPDYSQEPLHSFQLELAHPDYLRLHTVNYSRYLNNNLLLNYSSASSSSLRIRP